MDLVARAMRLALWRKIARARLQACWKRGMSLYEGMPPAATGDLAPATKRSVAEASATAEVAGPAAKRAREGGAPAAGADSAPAGAGSAPALRPATVGIRVALASHAGKRKQMEDAHMVVDAARFAGLLAAAGGTAPAGMRCALYGVLDGHNGKRVAELCCARLPGHVARELALLLRQQARSSPRAAKGDAAAAAAVPVHCWHSKKRVEAALRRACAAVEADAAGSGYDAEGCCCVAVLVIQDECHVLNVGDSRAVLVRRDAREGANDRCGDADVSGAPGVSTKHKHKFPWELGERPEAPPPAARALSLTTDHRATAPGERSRIVAAGGTVDASGRAEGMMEVSRTFGDAGIKRLCGAPQADSAKNAISAEPDVRVKLTLDHAKDEFLFLACDGLWTRFNPVDAASFLRTRLLAKCSYSSDGNRHVWGDLDKAARAIVDDAVQNKNCTDNVSVLVLQFAPLRADALPG